MELEHSGTPVHPDLEDLAAFVDGRLDREECARIRAHLGRCEECYDTFVETVRFQKESEAAAREPLPFPSERRREPRRWMPAASLAAAAVLLLAVGVPVYRSLSPTALAPDEITAALGEKAPVLAAETWPPAHRGGTTENSEGFEERQQSFGMGVEVVNLQLALMAGDRDRSRQYAARIGALLEKAPSAGEELERFYRNVSDELGSESVPPGKFLATAAAHGKDGFEPQVALLDLRYFELGKWAEAGRLAALAGEPEFFSRRDTRRFLRRFGGQEREAGADPQIQEDLARIETVLGREQLRAEDYRALESAFRSILRTYYPS